MSHMSRTIVEIPINWGIGTRDGKHHRIEGGAPGFTMCGHYAEKMPKGEYPPNPCVICFQMERNQLRREIDRLKAEIERLHAEQDPELA